ncbi:MAG: hypothetical protein MJY52_01275 [Bacteroidaceae bacterium]|nr:hypothetical protein [Bacteroidaceae bacterium]
MNNLLKSAMMLTVCAFTMCLFLTSCNDDDDNSPAGKTFNDLIKEDCDFVNSKYSSAESIRFLEVDAMLEDWFDETEADEMKVSEMTSIYQVDQKVVFLIHDLEKGTKSVEEVDDIFEGSDDMFIEDFKVTFEEAVKIMKASDEYSDIHTRYLTVRRPLYKDMYDHPLYIFGKYAGVDVNNGNIVAMTTPSFNDAMIDDFNWAREKYGKDVLFYEVHTTLSGYIDELPLNQIHVVCDTAIFEKPHEQKIYVARNFDKGIRHTFTAPPGWEGSEQFNPYDIRVYFKEAVRIFAESSVKNKHISVMTFRHILDPKYEHPMYIFGRVAGVDAVTGDVIPL